MSIGRNIRSRRQAWGWSQQALADTLGISKMMISKWERGASTPTSGRLVQLGEAFGCRPIDLIARYRVTVESKHLELTTKRRIEAHLSSVVESLNELCVDFCLADRIVIEFERTEKGLTLEGDD